MPIDSFFCCCCLFVCLLCSLLVDSLGAGRSRIIVNFLLGSAVLPQTGNASDRETGTYRETRGCGQRQTSGEIKRIIVNFLLKQCQVDGHGAARVPILFFFHCCAGFITDLHHVAAGMMDYCCVFMMVVYQSSEHAAPGINAVAHQDFKQSWPSANVAESQVATHSDYLKDRSGILVMMNVFNNQARALFLLFFYGKILLFSLLFSCFSFSSVLQRTILVHRVLPLQNHNTGQKHNIQQQQLFSDVQQQERHFKLLTSLDFDWTFFFLSVIKQP